MKINKHIIPIILLIILSLYTLRSYLPPDEIPYRGALELDQVTDSGDLIAYNAVNAYIIRDSIINKGDITPMWNPFFLSGTPLFIKPQVTAYYIQTIFLLFSPNAFQGIKLSIIFHHFLAALGIYILIIYLKLDYRIALASSIIYVTNPYIINEIIAGHTNILYPYALVPFIVLFTLRSLEKKSLVKDSIITAIFLSLQVHSGGQSIFLFTSLIFGAILSVKLIMSKNRKKALIKIIVIGIIVTIFLLGLTAIKVIPSSEYIKISSRQASFTYERSAGNGMSLSYLFSNKAIGIIPLILAIFSLPYFKKKRWLLFFLLFIMSILILTASPVYHIIWKYIPFFNRQKGLFKATFLFIFPISILAAYGISFIKEYSKKIKTLKNRQYIVLITIIILIAGNFLFFSKDLPNTSNYKEQLEKNNILQFISEDTGRYRFQNVETNGIDWGIGHLSVPLGLYDVYGYDNIWSIEYLPTFLSAANSERAKMYGILSMKYLTSTEPINVSGFKFVKKFEGCGLDSKGIPLCQPLKSQGPYLYKNEQVMQREYMADKGILLVGNDEQTINTMYGIMLNQNFDPRDTVIVKGKESINDYKPYELDKFDIIILLQGSIDSSSSYILNNYVNNGGKLIPDLTKNKQTFTTKDVEDVIKSTNLSNNLKNQEEIITNEITYDKLEIRVKGLEGFLVLSEKFSIFPGWKAFDDKGNEKEILRSNGIISSIYLNGDEEKIFIEYSPPGFKQGALITMCTSLLILSYFAFMIYKKNRKK